MPTTVPTQAKRDLTLVAVVGNPNTGKTTLFNVLTGFRQRVGNYPGVTVEKKTGLLRGAAGGRRIEVVDLPGAYSLAARSADEAVVLEVLIGHRAGARLPDLIVVVADATNLARNLFFASQILEIGIPTVMALSMVDLAEAQGLRIDSEALGRELGIPVVPVVATKQVGIDRLRRVIGDSVEGPAPRSPPPFPQCVRSELEGLRGSLADSSDGSNHHTSSVELLQTLLDPGGYHEARLTERCGAEFREELVERRERIQAAGESIAQVEARVRYGWIDPIIERAVTRVGALRTPRSEMVDRALTHRVFGSLFMLILMGACFQSIYAWAGPLMDAIDATFSVARGWVTASLPPGALQSLLANGVIAGAGAVLVFLPQILILFLFISILEDCGYMARVAFLLDRWMVLLGLNGKSFIPLLSSFACAVPGIMATRTI